MKEDNTFLYVHSKTCTGSLSNILKTEAMINIPYEYNVLKEHPRRLLKYHVTDFQSSYDR